MTHDDTTDEDERRAIQVVERLLRDYCPDRWGNYTINKYVLRALLARATRDHD